MAPYPPLNATRGRPESIPRWFGVVLLGGLLQFVQAQTNPTAPSPATAPTATELPAAAPPATGILSPAPGRPVIVQAGEAFTLRFQSDPPLGDRVHVVLRHARVTALTVALAPAGAPPTADAGQIMLQLRVPSRTSEGLYDVEVRADGRAWSAPRAVKVVEQFRTRFRFVHLSDMSIGDPSAPDFDPALPDEINLIAPEFIVATGDLTAWGRLLDDQQTWRRAVAFLARFDAPVYLVGGDHDPPVGLAEHVGGQAYGTFDYGRYHGVLLNHQRANDIDEAQLAYLKRDLDVERDADFTLLVAHHDDPAFLELLAPREQLPAYLLQRRVKLLITGGSDDWDRIEYADALRGLDLHYVRTAQASPALRGRAGGVSHYRVFEVDGQEVRYLYAAEDLLPDIDHSVPAGRLRIVEELRRPHSVELSVQNSLNQPFDGAVLWIAVQRMSALPPEIAGGKLLQLLDAGDDWLCKLGVDLPDKGGIKVAVATDGPLPPAPPVQARYDGPTDLPFTVERSPTGLSYARSAQTVRILLSNTGDLPIETYPVVRLNGSTLPLSSEGGAAWPVVIPPGGEVAITPRLILARLSPGPHRMQLILMEDPLRRGATFPVHLSSR